MDENLFRPFRYCYRTWLDGAAVFREELIKTSMHWQELGLKGSCQVPVPPVDELLAHQKQYELFESTLQMKHIVASKTGADADGWVPSELWEEAKQITAGLYRMLLEEVIKNKENEDELIRDEASLREVWPFDIED